MTSMINTNVLFDLIDFSGTTCPGCHPGEFLDQDGVRCLTCALGFFTEGRGSLFFMFNMLVVGCVLLRSFSYDLNRPSCMHMFVLLSYSCTWPLRSMLTRYPLSCNVFPDRNQNRCDACPSGYHGKNVTALKHRDRPVHDSCDSCPRGFFGDVDSSATVVGCKACESGRFSTRTGVSSARDTNNDGTICDACPR